MNTTTTNQSRNGSSQVNPAAATLWASAFVIAALVILQLGKLPGNPAHADGVLAERGNYTLLTTDAGEGDGQRRYQMLYVLDSSEQVLLVYQVEDAQRNVMTLRDGGNVNALFRAARR